MTIEIFAGDCFPIQRAFGYRLAGLLSDCNFAIAD